METTSLSRRAAPRAGCLAVTRIDPGERYFCAGKSFGNVHISRHQQLPTPPPPSPFGGLKRKVCSYAWGAVLRLVQLGDMICTFPCVIKWNLLLIFLFEGEEKVYAQNACLGPQSREIKKVEFKWVCKSFLPPSPLSCYEGVKAFFSVDNQSTNIYNLFNKLFQPLVDH